LSASFAAQESLLLGNSVETSRKPSGCVETDFKAGITTPLQADNENQDPSEVEEEEDPEEVRFTHGDYKKTHSQF